MVTKFSNMITWCQSADAYIGHMSTLGLNTQILEEFWSFKTIIHVHAVKGQDSLWKFMQHHIGTVVKFNYITELSVCDRTAS